MKKEQANWLAVLKVAMPLCLSYIPIGLACGVLLHAGGLNTWLIGLVSLIVYSGGAQFLIATMLTIHAPISQIVIMLSFLELRYALLGSSLSHYLKKSSHRFILGFAFSLNDENYAVNYLKFATDKFWTPGNALLVEHYALYTWALSNVIGSLIGSSLTINLVIVDFALTALFLFMVTMQVKRRLTLLTAILSGLLSAFFCVTMQSTLGIVIATLLASTAGFLADRVIRSMAPDSSLLYKVRGPSGTRETINDQELTEERLLTEQHKQAKDANDHE
ncbi:AzlC family ABC transporter permease [Furfurilactobacillus curtus]|uniref:Branched-chain amino acid ABC transporter n=1 Tax=Furfurilactobacillus curtus TaxID=1746200 RepID=A0ABQ5JPF7_9LACO